MEKRLRVCLVNPTLLLRRPISDLARHLPCEVAVLLPKSESRLHHSDLDVRLLSYRSYRIPGSHYEWPIPGLSFLRQAWTALGYDAVQLWAHFYPSNLLLVILSLFRPRCKVILTIDTFPGYSWSVGPVKNWLLRLYTWTLGRLIFWIPSTITLYGEALMPAARASGISTRKIRILPTGVNLHTPRTSRISIRRKLRLGKSPTVLYAGILNQRKRVGLLLGLARRMPKVSFLIAGDGPERSTLERRMREERLANVRLLDWRKDVSDLLVAADALVLPSSAEGLPGIVLEAMQLGTPVLSTRIPCTTDLIEDGKTGLLCPVDELECLQTKLTALLTRRRWARGLAAAAKTRIGRSFTWKRLLPQYLELYR